MDDPLKTNRGQGPRFFPCFLYLKSKLTMIRQIIKFIGAWYRGEDAEFEAHVSWLDIGAIIVILALLAWIRWK